MTVAHAEGGNKTVVVGNDETSPVPVVVGNDADSPVPVAVDPSTPIPVTLNSTDNMSVTVGNDGTSPIPVIVQNTIAERSEFVGFSAGTFNGAQGIVTYTHACRQSFAGSHMCTSAEFINTRNFPATTGSGWIHPTYAAIYPTGGTSPSTRWHDVSGRGEGNNMACNAWSSIFQGQAGLTVDAAGRFGALGCSNVTAVACCR